MIFGTFAVNKHDIIYMVDGEVYYRDEDVAYDTSVTMIAEPTKEGYTFSGWNTVLTTMPDEDVWISGTFSINQYTITFDTDGGSAVAPITQDYGTAVTAPADPTKAGYVFVGWDKAIPTTMPAENVTITAKWRVRNVIDNIIDNVVDWFTEDENTESLVVRIKFNGVDEDEFKEIKVNLLRNGKKYDSEDLSASKVSKKDWRYEWDNLDEDYNWSVDLAKELKGYNTEVVNLRGNYWTITLSKEEAPVFEKENPNTGAF